MRRTGAPLSASLDPLSGVAVGCARLLHAWATVAETGIDKTGDGRFVESYPAAALKAWGIDIGGSYKTQGDAATGLRAKLVNRLAEELADVLALSASFVDVCKGKGGDHHVDALICALTARTADLDGLEPIPPGARLRAGQEGWIRLPAARSIRESLG